MDTVGRLDMEKFDKGLLELRNTPNENGASPAQLVFGQEIRSVLPSITFKLMKERRRNYYNLRSTRSACSPQGVWSGVVGSSFCSARRFVRFISPC